MWIDILISIFLLIGASFALTGSIGLFRMPDFYMRIHGPTKATTLGVGGVLIASVLYFSYYHAGLHLHEVLVTAFLFMTAPVSAHLASKAALHLRLEDVQGEVAENRGQKKEGPQ